MNTTTNNPCALFLVPPIPIVQSGLINFLPSFAVSESWQSKQGKHIYRYILSYGSVYQTFYVYLSAVMDIIQCNLLVKTKRKVNVVIICLQETTNGGRYSLMCFNLHSITVEESLGRFTACKPRVWYVYIVFII
jgi:hypothetical protein